jgi:hypothetical protein
MTAYGTRKVDRATAFQLATRNVGRLVNQPPNGGFIGFTKRDMKRRDVVALIDGQETQDVCTIGLPFWFQARIWFLIGDEITETEWDEITKAHRAAWEARKTSG